MARRTLKKIWNDPISFKYRMKYWIFNNQVFFNIATGFKPLGALQIGLIFPQNLPEVIYFCFKTSKTTLLKAHQSVHINISLSHRVTVKSISDDFSCKLMIMLNRSTNLLKNPNNSCPDFWLFCSVLSGNCDLLPPICCLKQKKVP